MMSFFSRLSGCSKCSRYSTIDRPPTRVNRSPNPFQIFFLIGFDRLQSEFLPELCQFVSGRTFPTADLHDGWAPSKFLWWSTTFWVSSELLQEPNFFSNLLLQVDFVRAPTGVRLQPRAPIAGRPHPNSYKGQTPSPHHKRSTLSFCNKRSTPSYYYKQSTSNFYYERSASDFRCKPSPELLSDG